MDESIDILPRYSLTIRITKKQKDFLKKLRKENKIPAAYYIRTLLDDEIDKFEGERDGEREQNPK